jgi:hypothetical protein
MCWMLLLLTQMDLFWEIHMFLQLDWIGPCGTKWAFLQLENTDLHEVLLSKTNSVLTGRQSARCCSIYHRSFQIAFFGEINVFLHLSWVRLVVASRAYPYLIHLSFRKYSFQNLTQFFHGNNIWEASTSNKDSFLAEIHVSNTNLILTGKQCSRSSSFSHKWLSLGRYMCSFNSTE